MKGQRDRFRPDTLAEVRYWEEGRCLHVLEGHAAEVHDLNVHWETMEAAAPTRTLRSRGRFALISSSERCLEVIFRPGFIGLRSHSPEVSAAEDSAKLWNLKIGGCRPA